MNKELDKSKHEEQQQQKEIITTKMVITMVIIAIVKIAVNFIDLRSNFVTTNLINVISII